MKCFFEQMEATNLPGRDKSLEHLCKWVRLCLLKLSRLCRRFSEWQKRGVTVVQKSECTHSCQNCGQTFAGNFCPRCGQSATAGRITLRSALSRTLEVWGLGNRSLPRTLLHLCLRPGYMIGDYLEGRQIAFFPPMKLLFLVTAAYFTVCHFMGHSGLESIEPVIDVVTLPEGGEPAYEAKGRLIQAVNAFSLVIYDSLNMLRKHYAVFLVLMHGLYAWLSKLIFRHSPVHSGMSFTECFFVQIFIAAQLMALSIVKVCLSGVGGRHFMYELPDMVFCIVLFIDYKQLYGCSYLKTLWRTALLMLGWVCCLTLLLVLTMFGAIGWYCL